jgi:uncharacterized protein DUF1501/cytochrome c
MINCLKRPYVFAAMGAALRAQPGWVQSVDPSFFETKIRPVLATRCFGCHSSMLAAPRAELALDTKAGLSKGGVTGAVVIPGKPDESRLIRHDLHATLLNQLGIDHKQLTYRFAGRDFRLTDVFGNVVSEIV